MPDGISLKAQPTFQALVKIQAMDSMISQLQ